MFEVNIYAIDYSSWYQPISICWNAVLKHFVITWFAKSKKTTSERYWEDRCRKVCLKEIRSRDASFADKQNLRHGFLVCCYFQPLFVPTHRQLHLIEFITFSVIFHGKIEYSSTEVLIWDIIVWLPLTLCTLTGTCGSQSAWYICTLFLSTRSSINCYSSWCFVFDSTRKTKPIGW